VIEIKPRFKNPISYEKPDIKVAGKTIIYNTLMWVYYKKHP
jgi:hypothetical protein